MKTKLTKTIKNLFLTTMMLVTLGLLSVNAQVTPTTPDVKLFCAETDLNLGTPPANTEWRILYSAISTTTPSGGPTLTGNVVAAANVQTGYYYAYTVGDATHPEICASEFTEFPVYKFATLAVAFAASNYCEEDAADQTFTGTATTTEATALSYQWYTVVGGIETAISGATSKDYKPSNTVVAGTTTTYRLKAGFAVAGLRYCSDFEDNAVVVTAKPGKPAISVQGSTGETI